LYNILYISANCRCSATRVPSPLLYKKDYPPASISTMQLSNTFLALASVLALTSALPTAQELPRACGTKIFPTLYTLSEATPTATSAASPPFSVSQDVSSAGKKSNRVYTLAHFSGSSFAGSYGCTLHLNIPSTTPVTTHGSAALNVQTVAWPSSGTFTPTWNSVSPLIQSGVFGTITAASGSDAYINSGSCPASGSTAGLTYIFEVAEYVNVNAGVSFTESSGVGPYLTFGC